MMDSVYDVAEIRACSETLGRVPIMDTNPRTRARKQALVAEDHARRAARRLPAERRRLRERSTVEQGYGRLKEEFGGCRIQVHGHMKVIDRKRGEAGQIRKGSADPLNELAS